MSKDQSIRRHRSFGSTGSTKLAQSRQRISEMFNRTEFGFFTNLSPLRSRLRQRKLPAVVHQLKRKERYEPQLLSQVLDVDDVLIRRSMKLQRPIDHNRATYLNRLLFDHNEKLRLDEEIRSNRSPYTRSFHFRYVDN